MNSWGPAPGDSALWNTAPESGTPAWPPYKLPSDYLPSSSTSIHQAHYVQGTVHPARQGLHGPVPLMPEQSTPQHDAPMSGAPPSSGAPCSAMQGALTTVPRHSVPITYHAPYSVNNQPHGGLPLESYFTAHLQYPKTWVHLWDRLPLREPETLISSSYRLEMFVHHSAVSTLRAVASGSNESAPMLAVSCQEKGDNGIRLSLYHDTYDAGKDQAPLKVDTFVTVKKALPPQEQDEIAAVSSLASAFQAACNTSSLPRLCHLLPMQLTAGLSTPLESAYPSAGPEGDQAAEPPVQLSGTVLQPNVSVSLTQLHRMKVLECMLTARLLHGGAEHEDDRFRSGVLSIEQSRSLVPLLHVDPMADQAPLVGIWVTGVSSITNSLVLSAALAFHTSNAKRTKAVAPDGSFLVLAFISPSTKVPEVYEACLSSPRGVPLMPFSVSAKVPAPVDPILRALACSPNPESRAQAEQHSELRNMSKALLIERPHMLYSLFVDRAPQAAASALAAVSVPGGTASAHIPMSSLPTTRHVQGRASAASLSAWRTDAPLAEQATSDHKTTHTHVISTNAASQGAPGNYISAAVETAGSRQGTANTSAPHPERFQPSNASSTPSRVAHLQGATATAFSQSADTAGLNTGLPDHAHRSSSAAAPNVAAPRTGVPPVPSPSPLVGHFMTPLHSRTYGGAHQAAAQTPALGVADRGTLHGLPGAAITGPGPLSVGSLAPSVPRTGRYGPLFDGHHAAGAAAMPPQQQQLPPQSGQSLIAGGQAHATTAPASTATQNTSVPSLHSNMHALFVGAAPTPTPTVPAASSSMPSAGADQRMTSLQGAAAPASAMSGRDTASASVPEWLASAVHRHPDLAPLLRNQAAIVANEGSVTADTPADSGTPAAASTAAPASFNGDTHMAAAGNTGSQTVAPGHIMQHSGQHIAHAAAAPGEQAALVALLNDASAPTAAASDAYSRLISVEPDQRDLASTRQTSFADDPTVNVSAAQSMHAAGSADQSVTEAPVGDGRPADASCTEASGAACVSESNRDPGSSICHTSGHNTGNQNLTGLAPAGLAPVMIPHQQQQCTLPQAHVQGVAQDSAQSVPQPLAVCSNTCAQEGPSTPRAKRGTCEAHSSSKKQRVSPPQALFSRSPQRASPGGMQHAFTATDARGRVGTSDALVHMHSNKLASSLAHLPVPSVPVSATQDPETASALGPLYEYIGKLRQHISLLQDQVCHLSGRAANGVPVHASAEQCSQSLAALHISQPPVPHPSQEDSANTAAQSHEASGCETQSHRPPDVQDSGARMAHQHGASPEPIPSQADDSVPHSRPSRYTTQSDTGGHGHMQAAVVVHPRGDENVHPELRAEQDSHRRTDSPVHASAVGAHAPNAAQNDALEAIVDAFLVSSAGGVHDNLPGYPPPIHTSREPRRDSAHDYQGVHARQKASDVVRHSHRQAELQRARNRTPLSPRSLNIPQSPTHTDAAAVAAAPGDHANTAGSSMMGTPASGPVRYRMGERGSVVPSECQSSAGAPPWEDSVRVETAALAASCDGSTRSVRTPPPVDTQHGRRAHERNDSGATCLSPELAALIRDAEHVNGQDYEDSLCLREEASVSDAHASSRHVSSNGGAPLEGEKRPRGPRRILGAGQSNDSGGVHGGAEQDHSQALILDAKARSKQHSLLSERTSELMQRASRLKASQGGSHVGTHGGSQGGSQGATPPRGATAVPLHHHHHPKRRGSAAGASSATGGGYSSRTADSYVRWSAAAESLDGREAAAAILPEKYASVPRIKLPPTSAGKKALKLLLKDKGLKKKLNKTELIDDDIDDTNEEDTTTSFSDDELQEKLEKKYGLRP